MLIAITSLISQQRAPDLLLIGRVLIHDNHIPYPKMYTFRTQAGSSWLNYFVTIGKDHVRYTHSIPGVIRFVRIGLITVPLKCSAIPFSSLLYDMTSTWDTFIFQKICSTLEELFSPGLSKINHSRCFPNLSCRFRRTFFTFFGVPAIMPDGLAYVYMHFNSMIDRKYLSKPADIRVYIGIIMSDHTASTLSYRCDFILCS